VLERASGLVPALARRQHDRWRPERTIARTGGVAIFTTVAWLLPADLGIAAALIFLLGLADDLVHLSAAVKAIGLAVVSGAAALVLGRPEVAPLIFLICTATNLMDHADGVAASAVLVSTALSGTDAGWITAMACLGFLARNYPPATIMMGDSGSYLLGFMIVVSWIGQGWERAVLGSSLPLFELAFVLIRRTIEGRAFWIGGTDHTSHIMMRFGLDPRALPVLVGLISILILLPLVIR
jgi:UDP-GlcNAc:undecaprenyl-phosphate/decaprenyl-phosphate GlcNAc-1-phosphate transferase